MVKLYIEAHVQHAFRKKRCFEVRIYIYIYSRQSCGISISDAVSKVSLVGYEDHVSSKVGILGHFCRLALNFLFLFVDFIFSSSDIEGLPKVE